MEELRQKAARRSSRSRRRQVDEDLLERIRGSHGAELDEATQVQAKLERQDAIDAVEEEVARAVRAATGDGDEADRRAARRRSTPPSTSSRRTIIRKRIAVDKKRPDGRAQDEIRPIECEVDISPRVHGSALFTRGETQILSNVALGTTPHGHAARQPRAADDEAFWHHYNFPPFSVGEAGFMRGPKRRDIGHGALAERALVGRRSRARRSSPT